MNNHHMEQETQRLLDRLKIDIPSVRLLVERLSGGQRQAVAIARATAFNSKVTIMDEPTAALSVAAISQGARPGARAQSAGRFDHHHQPPPGRRLPGERPDDGPAPWAQGPATVLSKVDIDEFREKVVAYIIGARDDFAQDAVA